MSGNLSDYFADGASNQNPAGDPFASIGGDSGAVGSSLPNPQNNQHQQPVISNASPFGDANVDQSNQMSQPVISDASPFGHMGDNDGDLFGSAGRGSLSQNIDSHGQSVRYVFFSLVGLRRMYQWIRI